MSSNFDDNDGANRHDAIVTGVDDDRDETDAFLNSLSFEFCDDDETKSISQDIYFHPNRTQTSSPTTVNSNHSSFVEVDDINEWSQHLPIDNLLSLSDDYYLSPIDCSSSVIVESVPYEPLPSYFIECEECGHLWDGFAQCSHPYTP